jgi:23S rRNA (guanosine2251-2'-O)-methyltransferase
MFDDKKRGPRPARNTPGIPPARRTDGPREEFPGRGDPRGGEYRRDGRPRYAGYSPRTEDIRDQEPAPADPQSAREERRERQPRAGYQPRRAPVEPAENMLVGRNPIREALRAGMPVEKLIVADGDLSGAARDIIALAREKNVIVQKVDRFRLDQIYPAHQGMIAYVAQAEYSSVAEIMEHARELGEDPFLVILDGITDPHNMGAIIRSAECAGAHGVIIPERRSCGLTPVVAKAAAGSLSYMRVARVTNLNRTIDELKEMGVWFAAAALDGEDAFRADLTGPMAVVVGSEGDGISRLTLEKCDRRITLPMKGHIDSLNASVAAGILLYEVMRARRMA